MGNHQDLKKLNTWFLYVVECADNTLYTGITTDTNRRLYEHNCSKKGAKYTRSRRPVSLVYVQSFENRSTAAKAESAFKKLTRQEKLRHVQNKTKHSDD